MALGGLVDFSAPEGRLSAWMKFMGVAFTGLIAVHWVLPAPLKSAFIWYQGDPRLPEGAPNNDFTDYHAINHWMVNAMLLSFCPPFWLGSYDLAGSKWLLWTFVIQSAVHPTQMLVMAIAQGGLSYGDKYNKVWHITIEIPALYAFGIITYLLMRPCLKVHWFTTASAPPGNRNFSSPEGRLGAWMKFLAVAYAGLIAVHWLLPAPLKSAFIWYMGDPRIPNDDPGNDFKEYHIIYHWMVIALIITACPGWWMGSYDLVASKWLMWMYVIQQAIHPTQMLIMAIAYGHLSFDSMYNSAWHLVIETPAFYAFGAVTFALMRPCASMAWKSTSETQGASEETSSIGVVTIVGVKDSNCGLVMPDGE